MEESLIHPAELITSEDRAAIMKMCDLIARLYLIRREFESLEGVEQDCISCFSNAIGDSIGSCSEAITHRIEHSVMH